MTRRMRSGRTSESISMARIACAPPFVCFRGFNKKCFRKRTGGFSYAVWSVLHPVETFDDPSRGEPRGPERSAPTVGMLSSSNLSVPGFATWDLSRPAHDERSSRRCCIDEFGAWLGKWVPCVRPFGVLNGTMPCTLVFSETSSAPWPIRRTAAFVDAWLRSAAQVVMINNPLAGLLIMSACCFPSAIVGAHGALGLTGAVTAAFALGLDRQARASGLFGYNGLLVGMALATLLYRGEDGWDALVGIANRQTLPPPTS